MSVQLERDGAIARIVLSDPERRNPLTVDFPDRVLSLLDELERDTSCRVIIFTGQGPVFCAGADLGGVLHPDGVDPEQQYQLVRGFNRVVKRMRELDLPIIGALNGPSVGGGTALALACDFAIATPSAALMFAFGRVGGTSADMGCTWLLSRLVGPARASQLLLTGTRLEASDAVAMGIYCEVVDEARLAERAQELAEEIIEASPRRASAATKMALGLGAGIDLSTALDYEAFVQSWAFRTDEHQDRLRAFLATRK